MKLYSNGGKYSADSKPQNKKRKSSREATDVLSKRTVVRDQVNDYGNRSANLSHEERIAARKAESRKRQNRNMWITAALIFFGIIAATLIFLLVRKVKVSNDYQKLAQQIQQAEDAHAATTPSENMEEPEVTISGTFPEETVDKPDEETILPKYQALYEENPEFFGWIRMDDTALDYPVMRSSEDNDEYLYGDFEGDYCYAGVPFADYRCDRDSDNILIYGHNIRDGSMFRSLFKYEDKNYWREHPTIMFSDLYGDYEYEVLAVFRDRVYYKYEDVFKFYQFMDAENAEDFDYAISQFKEKSLYDTGVNAEYGDKLITLITCAYHVEDGRFVVVARRK